MDIERLKGATCPDCNGGGVYQEYDEYDRYTVHSCATCDGSGEIARQSVTSEEIVEAIDQIESLIKAIGNDMHWRSEKLMKSLNLAITALQKYQLKPDCESAEKRGDKCCGYGKSENDDEPIDVCKSCDKQASYDVED